jgi:glycerol-3-phosphate dehydrogenase
VSVDGELLAEVEYAIENEMAIKLTDILFRRTGIGTLGYPGDEIFNKVVNIASKRLNWDSNRTQQEVELAKQLFELPM